MSIVTKSRATLATPIACQASLSMEFPRQEYWSEGVGYHFLLQGIFLTLGLNACLLLWQGDSLQTETHTYNKNLFHTVLETGSPKAIY